MFVLLRQKSVIEIFFDIIGVLCLSGKTIQIVRQTHHIVDRAEFLIAVTQEMSLHLWRHPEFTRVLSAGAVGSTLRHRKSEEILCQLFPSVIPGDLIHFCRAMRPRDAGVCMAVCQRVLSFFQLAENGRMMVRFCQSKIFLLTGQFVKRRPYLQHAAFLATVHRVRIFYFHILYPVHIPVADPIQDCK